MIWSSDYLAQLNIDAGKQISTDLNSIYNRSMLAITEGLSVYRLPNALRSLMRITYRGYKLEPMNWEQFTLLTPSTVFLNETYRIENSNSRPFWYTIHPTNLFDIRLYPAPNETFTADGDPFSPGVNDSKCIISYYQIIEPSSEITSLPVYIDRRIRKAYVLWQAFSAEGKGQNLRASEYYRNKYFFLIERFKMINQGCYVSKKYTLGNDNIPQTGRYPRPMLPSNFERRYY